MAADQESLFIKFGIIKRSTERNIQVIMLMLAHLYLHVDNRGLTYICNVDNRGRIAKEQLHILYLLSKES